MRQTLDITPIVDRKGRYIFVEVFIIYNANKAPKESKITINL